MKYQDTQSQEGFAVVEALLVLLVIGLLVGVGYWVLKQRGTTTLTSSSTPVVPIATKDTKSTQGFSDYVSNDLKEADKSNDSVASSYASASQSDSSAVSSVGDAYNESNY